MTPEEYRKKTIEADKLVRAGKYNEAVQIMQTLITSDLPDRDKTMMHINIAVIYKMMNMPRQAIGAYDQAIKYESLSNGYFALWQKATYLSEIGEKDDSLKTFQSLLENTTLKPEERFAIEKNIEILKNRN